MAVCATFSSQATDWERLRKSGTVAGTVAQIIRYFLFSLLQITLNFASENNKNLKEI